MASLRLFKKNAWVYLDGEAVCLNVIGVPVKRLLKAHVADQKAYIARLEARVKKIDEFLNEKPKKKS